jgi:tripeptide aminopeptidase
MRAGVDGDRLVRHFLELVRIDSPSFDEQELARRLEADLNRLGLAVTNDRSGPNGTGNVVAVWPGRGGLPIALSAHLDTVEPGRGVTPRIVDGVIRSDGRTILGADCKAGLAIIVEALHQVMERGLPHGHIELLLTYGEERGHAGAKTLRLDDLQARLAVVLDGTGPPGTIIAAAPSYDSVKAVFRGRAAHAGLEPEKGRSAIVAAADAVRRMPLGRLDEETTANIGLIRGGTARNVVPDRAELEGEARSRDNAKLARLTATLRAAMEAAAHEGSVQVDVTVVREYSAYRLDERHPGVALALQTARKLGLPSQLAAMGGGSDANTFNERGLASVVLGIGMQQPHTLEEHIAVNDLVRSTEYLVELITQATEDR